MPGSVASGTCSPSKSGARRPRRSPRAGRARRPARRSPASSVAGEHRAGRVVRRVQQDQSGAWLIAAARSASQVRPRSPVRAASPAPVRAPAIAMHGRVGVVVGLERTTSSPGSQQRQQRRGDRLGGAGGHQHLGVRVERPGRRSATGERRSPGAARGCPGPAGTGCSPGAAPRRAAARAPRPGRRCRGSPGPG